MAFVIMEPCEGTCAGECMRECPVDCIFPPANFKLGETDAKTLAQDASLSAGEKIFVIDPEICIDCGACVTPCPVYAVKAEEDVPNIFKEYIEINRIEAEKRCKQ